MPVFKTLSDDDPLLLTSPLIRSVLKTAQYIEENGGIGLTPSGAFNRKFVLWAAGEFNWPGYSEEELFRVNKVLNEWDFPPVGDIHELLLGLKLARRYKGKLLLSKAGKSLTAAPGALFTELVPAFLFSVDHGAHLRRDSHLLGNWDIFLNVINVEADHGATRSALRETLYGAHDASGSIHDSISSDLYVTVLRPLCWAGLLKEDDGNSRFDEAFTKTELWRRTLRLNTDRDLKFRVIH
ncbi:hypothetical protein [Halocynthiibacter styelae]|uniref:Uncharacterized protein n=1 Tax=Halocynthiibacter styelae TaxID=2761955 RepID=A0A8J7IE99_9RHOB|nr:hypothetical protein [Paenihalocynthiibacter styelae]MBI1494504.1 hypothetical protein [Paenihalocynthiibacter styelae]